MFIQNQISSLPNHFTKIKEILSGSDLVMLMVSYIRDSGVSIILDDLKSVISKKGKVQLICSSEMGITDPSAIKKLLDVGVEVKVFKLEEGTFHAKVWLSKIGKKWYCLVGSANCSKGAFLDNVEASLVIDTDSNLNGAIEQALIFFKYLWDSDKCFFVNNDILETWKSLKNNRIQLKEAIENVSLTDNEEKIFNFLFDYVKSWIDISKEKKQKDDFRESLWRGWYIIPDQDPINDTTMRRLKDIINIILEDDDYKKNGFFDISPTSKSIEKILTLTKSKFKRTELKMDLRALFIRQEKNYLRRFGLVEHPLKDNGKEDEYKLIVTPVGKNFAGCGDIPCMKKIYTETMLKYKWGNLHIFPFTLKLLQKLSFLNLDEFSLFVMHAYSDEDFNDIKMILQKFRQLSLTKQKILLNKINKYFEQIKGKTAKNVVGNYYKHAKYTMSAIGWVDGISYDETEKKLKITDNKIVEYWLNKLEVE